jgi:ATP-dependent RNA helicase SUPV3L1/SUV3
VPQDAAPAGAEVVEEAKPAEPEFDEIWYPGGRRPEHRHEHRRDNNRAPRQAAADAAPADGAATGEASDPREDNGRPRHHHRPRHQANGENGAQSPGGNAPRAPRPERRDARPRFDRNGAGNGGDKSGEQRGPGDDKKPFDKSRSFGPKPAGNNRREPAFDPDSPFAALAVLRDRKPE